MPELPEVETIIRDLRPLVVGRTIVSVRVLEGNPTLVRGCPPEALDTELRGRRVASIDRRGKYVLFALEGGCVLAAHLRMTGALLHRRADDAEDAYTRAVIALDDGAELRFADLRKFGTLHLVENVADATGVLGPEPLGPDFTVAYLAKRARNRSAPVKSFLLNQSIIAGIGNIYADEALFAARIDPRRAVGELTSAEIAELHAAVRAVLAAGIRHRGVSFRNYRDAAGNVGANQSYVRVFRRTGQPCDVCGVSIARVKIGGRSTHHCPACQR